ncbi:peroxisomal membrane protein 11A isoform X2 [Tiliqua scincoides]|uniref:peroxisomal membrane protein 11A isoform X2 n=1 Tax=Tiliqua scincoides TaxID=71010 RepID=UPI00346349BC
MEAFVDFTNQTQGRERLLRATQYSCMLLSYMLEHKMGKEKVVTKLKQLETSMSSGRKSNLNRTLYFICDTILWVRSVGLCSDINKKKWRHRATKCYYYSLVLNLIEDVYELCWRMEQTVRTEKAQTDLPPNSQRVQNLVSLLTGGLQPFLLLLCLTLRKHPPLLLDTVKNLCDLSSPLDRLGICKTNPGIIGLCGIISSIVGILTVASPRLRLKP